MSVNFGFFRKDTESMEGAQLALRANGLVSAKGMRTLAGKSFLTETLVVSPHLYQ